MHNENISWKFDTIQYLDFVDQKIELYGTLTSIDDVDFEIYVNHVYVGFDLHREKKIDQENTIQFHITVPLSKEPHHLQVVVKGKDSMTEILEMNEKDLKKVTIDEGVYACIDKYVIIDGIAQVSGYAYSTKERPLTISVTDSDDMPLDVSYKALPRTDLVNDHIVPESLIDCGFLLSFKAVKNRKYTVTFSDEPFTKEIVLKHTINKAKAFKVLTPKSINRVVQYVRTYGVAKPFVYIKEKGLKHAIKKFLKDRDDVNYDAWLKEQLPTQEELERQRNEHFAYEPLLSLVVACYNTPLNFLKEMIESVEKQSYPNYELCIADGSNNEDVKNYIESLNNAKIRYVFLNGNKGISENMNAALQLAAGDYIGFFDHDDVLAPDALYQYVKLINENSSIQMIYCDEDKIDESSTKYFNPNFKPDFNIDLLTSVNYICHFLVVSKSLLKRVGTFNKDYDGAQDYDFVLRCADVLEEKQIAHIPHILYHWRFHENSTAGNAESKKWAFDAGKRALEAFYRRHNILANVEKGRVAGLYRTHYEIIGRPLISIIIPNKDHIDDLKRCIESIFKSTYTHYEILIVENNSEDPNTFKYYDHLEDEYENIHVYTWKKEFNYSAINNYGEKHAHGDYVLLLNNDTQVITENWLEEMLGLCQRKDVGAVGAKLIYPDHTIQHAGVVIGIEGMAGHVFLNYPEDDLGYNGYLQIVRDYSAVTAACMMVKKAVYDEVGGLTEQLRIAFNDIDFCLKMVDHGYHIVYTPYAKLYHFESKSRGEENNPEKVKRFNSEVTYLLQRWGDFMVKGDPAYNPNLSLVYKNDFNLKAHPDENELDWFMRQHGFKSDEKE